MVAQGVEPGFQLRRRLDAGGVQRVFVIDTRQDLLGRDAVEPEPERREIGAGVRGVSAATRLCWAMASRDRRMPYLT